MDSDIIKYQQGVYRRQFLEQGDGPDGTFNQNNINQELRFERLINQFDLSTPNQTIHDVGCGICDLYPYLKRKGFETQYSGTEIIQEMKELALNKYPELEIEIRDIINDKITDRYDYVVLAGTFNLPGNASKEDWKKFTRDMISSMFFMCNKGISFNFLTSYADFYNDLMYYENPQEIVDFCVKELSRFVVIDQSYPLYEFTVTVFKSEYMQEVYAHKKLEKYF